MTSGYEFRLAGFEENEALCEFFRESSIPGNISLAFARDPSFFTASQAGSISHQTVIYQHKETKKIAGVGCRNIRKLYVGGVSSSVGYMSNLRNLPETRNGFALAKGLKFCRELHRDGAVPYYLASILDDNSYARCILESGRAGMPKFTYIGDFNTYLISIRKIAKNAKSDSVEKCSKDYISGAYDCLDAWNYEHQFAPAYLENDISGNTGLLPCFSSDDLYVYRDGNEILGTLGVWDQRTFKQTIVTDYSQKMKFVKPIYDAVAKIAGYPGLPGIGEEFRCVYASFISSKGNNKKVFRSLIQKACEDKKLASVDFLIVGLSREHELEDVARHLASRILPSRIYIVHWEEDNISIPIMDRPIHLEVATL
jgi:hypothetical protein